MNANGLFLLVASVCLPSLLLVADEPVDRALARRAANVGEIIGHKGSCADRPENTLVGLKRAIEAGAHVAEVDVRTTRDGVLVCLHDADVDRTTDGKGKVAALTWVEVQALDAGAKFDPKFAGERIPALKAMLQLAKGRIGVMLDLKETGDAYAHQVVEEVRKFGEPKRCVVGVRSIEQATLFGKLLPESRQIGLIPTQADIEPFAEAGVNAIRLWPKWLTDETLVPRVRATKRRLHLGTGTGTKAEVLPLLKYEPESLSSDDPARLVKTLAELRGE